MDIYNSHRRLEMLSKSLYDLNRDSMNYWSMLFSIAKALFKRCNELGVSKEDDTIELQKKVNDFLIVFKSSIHGKNYIPTLFEIESKIDNMNNTSDVLIIRDRSYSFGMRTREVTKYEIMYRLSIVRDWIFLKTNSFDIKYSVPNLNVEV